MTRDIIVGRNELLIALRVERGKKFTDVALSEWNLDNFVRRL